MLAVSPRATARKRTSGRRLPALSIDAVENILQGYGQRGVFKGISRGDTRAGVTTFRMLWHHDLAFRLLLDERAKTLAFATLLPKVPARSEMQKAFKTFVDSFGTDKVPDHRRVDRSKTQFKATNSRGNASIAVMVKDGDYEYATRKLIHVVQEVFLVFLCDGPYFEYRVENFGLNPDIT